MAEKRTRFGGKWNPGQEIFTVNMDTLEVEEAVIDRVQVTIGKGGVVLDETYYVEGSDTPIDVDLIAKARRTAETYAKVFKQAMSKMSKPVEVEAEEE